MDQVDSESLEPKNATESSSHTGNALPKTEGNPTNAADDTAQNTTCKKHPDAREKKPDHKKHRKSTKPGARCESQSTSETDSSSSSSESDDSDSDSDSS